MTTADKPDERPRISLRARLVFFGFSLVIALLCGELALRALGPDAEIRKRLRAGGVFEPFEPDSEADHWGSEFQVTYRINSRGFRDRERVLDKKPGVKRLLFLGDSFTVGWGVEQDQAYPHLLEEALGAECWNLARSGNNPLFYLAQARVFIPTYAPDALLVQIFDNDVQECQHFAPRFKLGQDGVLGEVPEKLSADPGFGRRMSEAFNKLALRRGFRALKRRFEGKPIVRQFVRVGANMPEVTPGEVDMTFKLEGRDPAFENYFAWTHPDKRQQWAEAFSLERSLLTQLSAECEKARLPLAFVYIPHAAVFSDSDMARELKETNPHRALLQEVCQAGGHPLWDATALLDGPRVKDLYYPHDLHLNAAGHAALASALEAPIKAWLK